MPQHYKFTAVPDIFASFAADCAADPKLKIKTQPDLALLPRAYESDGPSSAGKSQWERFAAYVGWLNERAEDGVCYKVLYLTRHGQGWHNVVHERVGTEEWDNNLSKLDGDGTLSWSDAHLTPEGQSQATALSSFWTSLISSGAPIPERLYTSPLTRCLETTDHIWRPIFAARALPFSPIIKENLREQITDHTCDRRSPLARIRELFPAYTVEDGFTEEDGLWRADVWEPLGDHCVRKQRVLEDIFAREEGAADFLSLSIHSFAIAVILHVCGAEMFRVSEGTSIGILVRAEKVDAPPTFEVGDRLEGF
ncbi:related to phosphoglycerate mutase [Cephalotrichum gorgonifer]|uniref:Related to phosphoglycerate mutase n=1 Tax=Cephalotrichum gorgonifer TaxID=2041049 RepID=A0AAE8N004_9PEZI|nr:related to phosphoglycerate mutase [Cephalotrichum gorgonifer]